MKKPSFSHHGHFTVTRVIEIPEICVTLTELQHEKVGSTVLHIFGEDDENLFNLSFRTLPHSSNGIAHILEHTVLCGSKKYPVKDPFFSMGRRSLNTFMNAFTGADFTCYPASSQVEKDFYNLLEVYLDSVFYPRLTLESFKQEGHRLEFAEKNDPSSPLVFKGIVYNEMKGALSSPETRLNEALMKELFPNLTYGINSGGDPKEIPLLTHEELKAFHQKYYHPSRCLFFFYGNLPLEKHLDFLEEKVLKDVTFAPPLPPLALQKRFTKKVTKVMTYPSAKEEGVRENTNIAFGFLTCSILEQEEILALNVLDLVLMGTDAAPLKMALLKSNLCKQADSSLEDEISEVPFIITCKGCPKDAGDGLEKVIFESLKECAEKGIPLDLLEGAIHQLELSRKEISAPFGLALYFRSAFLKHHGGLPEDGLKVHTLFKNLREKIKNPHFFPSLIRKRFLENPHFVRVVMHPDLHLEAKEKKEEESTLQAIKASLSEKEIESIITSATQLELYQKKEENLDLLPKIALIDVPKQGKEFTLEIEQLSNLTLFCHPAFTNDVLYVDWLFNLPKLEENEIPLLRLFAFLLPQMGAGTRNYKENLDYMFKHTGGVSADLELFFQAEDPSQIKPGFALRSKAIESKVDKLFPLLSDIATSADFTDTDRLQELLMQHFEELETSIENSPLRYAIQLATSSISMPLTLRNKWYGLDYFWKLKEIMKGFEKDRYTLVEKLQNLQKKILPLNDSELVLACDQELFTKLKKERFYGLEKLQYKEYEPWFTQTEIKKVKSHARLTAAPVAFTAMIFPSISYVDKKAAQLSLASKIMENKTLHKKIREMGGAYGSGATNVPMSGHFYFYSYRDPHLKMTLQAFKEAVSELIRGEFDENDLEEAKLGILQDLDSPVAPGSRAYIAYDRIRSKRTPEYRQQYRDILFASLKKDVIEAAIEVLVPGIEQAIVVSFGGKELLEKENVLPLLDI